ncbi:MAG TPA: alpha/beta hydrolase [Casimicrobiaceae bacterium]|nr:alpha/beta hydrolase [Casimicrobiaceae bacterium]
MRKAFWAVTLAVASGVTWATYHRYARDIRRARERVTRGSRVIDTACGRIEYAMLGDGDPVLVIHGAGGGFDQGLEFAGALVERGLRVIAMSRFGYLRTPLPDDPSPAAQADAHAALLDALDIPRAAIIGASAGAPSAMQFALRYPDRCSALVLMVPAAYVPRPAGSTSLETPAATSLLFDTALRCDFLFWLAPRIARSLVLRGIVATPPRVVASASRAERARVERIIDCILPVSRRRLGLVNDARITLSLQRYELERIGAPTLVVSVADDLFGTFDPARYTAAHIPGAQFVGYPSGGHLWVGHHAEVVLRIVDFLRTHPVSADKAVRRTTIAQ